MAHIFEVISKMTDEIHAKVSHPDDRDRAKKEAEKIAEDLKQKFDIDCFVNEI